MFQHNPKIERQRVSIQEQLEELFNPDPLHFDTLLFSYLLNFTSRACQYINVKKGEQQYPLNKLEDRYQYAWKHRLQTEMPSIKEAFSCFSLCFFYLDNFLGPFVHYKPVCELIKQSICIMQIPDEDKESSLAMFETLRLHRQRVINFVSKHIDDCNFLQSMHTLEEACDDSSEIMSILRETSLKSAIKKLCRNHASKVAKVEQYEQTRQQQPDYSHRLFRLGISKEDKLKACRLLKRYYNDETLEMTKQDFLALNQSHSRLKKVVFGSVNSNAPTILDQTSTHKKPVDYC